MRTVQESLVRYFRMFLIRYRLMLATRHFAVMCFFRFRFWSKYTPIKYFMKSDAVTEVLFTFKEYIDRFLSCCREPYMINSVLKSFILRRFSLIQLLMLASVFHHINSLYLRIFRSTLK